MLLGFFTPALLTAGPVLRVVRASAPTSSLLQNGDFEQGSANAAPGWDPQPGGYATEPIVGRGGSRAICCLAPNDRGSLGAGQTIDFGATNQNALVVRGWSKAQKVSGSSDSGYSLYVDLVYADGTPLWGQTADFRAGTHDWEERQLVLLPEKPIKRLSVYCLFRNHSGTAWFDDVRVEALNPGPGAIMFQGVPMAPVREQPKSSGKRLVFKTMDGLELHLRGNAVSGVAQTSESGLLPASRLQTDPPIHCGFMARDVAANSDVFSFSSGACPELGLRLKADFVAQSNHLVCSGQVSDTTGHERAVTLLFALPLEAAGWRWGDDIQRSRIIDGNREFSNTVQVGCGATGTMSLYPLAALYNDNHGLALALDMGRPAVYRLVYHAGTKQLFIAYDFGLSPDTKRFPGRATFRFVVFQFEPRWGFRAAFQKLTEIFPEYFFVRSPDQGLWMPFTDVSTVPGWQEFGFKYHEGNNNVRWDAGHGILAFRYTEPMTWWMPMPKIAARTMPEALRIRDELCADGENRDGRMALVSRVAAMCDEAGQPCLQFRAEPWCNGAVWSLNPNPYLNPNSNQNLELNLNHNPAPNRPDATDSHGTHLNAATVHWNDSIRQQLYGVNVTPQLAGEYLDSLEGYTTANLNFRHDHFHDTTVPLVFDSDTKRPALFKGLAVYEFTRWFCDDVHRLGKLTFANGVPYRFTFLCPWLDVLGTETDWLSAGRYRPPPDSDMNLWRTMACRKPYLLLMNTDFDKFTFELIERYFQRSLFYGMFPGMFSHNAADNPYWRNPDWYNRDRPLFKKYLPLIKRVAEAGWQPVTAATCDNRNIWVERFGPDANGAVYFTVFNGTMSPQAAKLQVEREILRLPKAITEWDLLRGAAMSGKSQPLEISLAPQETTVLEVSGSAPGADRRAGPTPH